MIKFHEWLDTQRLELNVKQTKCMLINNDNATSTVNVNYKNSKVEAVEQFKYLGQIKS